MQLLFQKEGRSHQRSMGEEEKRTSRTDHGGGGAATGINRIALGLSAWAPAGADRGGSEEEMADTRVEEAGERILQWPRAQRRQGLRRLRLWQPVLNVMMKWKSKLPMCRAMQHNCTRSYVWTMAVFEVGVELNGDLV
jgi:hypothetical protein